MFITGLERHKFACKCGCGFDTVDVELYDILLDIEKWYGGVIKITSGCRCRQYNESIKEMGSPNYIPWSSKSQHMYGKAVDFKLDGMNPDMVYDYLDKKYINLYGIGKYNTFTHIDSRSKKARW